MLFPLLCSNVINLCFRFATRIKCLTRKQNKSFFGSEYFCSVLFVLAELFVLQLPQWRKRKWRITWIIKKKIVMSYYLSLLSRIEAKLIASNACDNVLLWLCSPGKSLLMDVDDKSVGKCSSFNSEVEKKEVWQTWAQRPRGPWKQSVD